MLRLEQDQPDAWQRRSDAIQTERPVREQIADGMSQNNPVHPSDPNETQRAIPQAPKLLKLPDRNKPQNK